MAKEMDEKEKTRRMLKEEVYTKYTDVVSSLMKKDYYKGGQATLTTFLALQMCAEAAKNNLIKMGNESSDLEKTRVVIIKEIWKLMGAWDNGNLKALVKEEREKQAAKAAEK
jgi:hypothetical protein